MSAIIQASPLENLSREPIANWRFVRPGHFWSSGDLTNRKLIPGDELITIRGKTAEQAIGQ